MNLTLNRVKSWQQQTPKGLTRWPGTATRKPNGEPNFRRGRVERVTQDCVSIYTEDHQLVRLMGDAYPHHCNHCQTTVPGNITFQRPAPLRHFCHKCGPGFELRMLEPGDKVRVHFRFGTGAGAQARIQTENAWGQWYAEIWDW